MGDFDEPGRGRHGRGIVHRRGARVDPDRRGRERHPGRPRRGARRGRGRSSRGASPVRPDGRHAGRRPRPLDRDRARGPRAARRRGRGQRGLRRRPPRQHARALGSRPRHQCRVGGDADDQGGRRDDRRWRDRPRRVDQRPRLPAGARRLQRLQGGPADVRQERRPPPRTPPDPGQRRLARLDVEPQHRTAVRHAGAGRRARRGIPAARADGGPGGGRERHRVPPLEPRLVRDGRRAARRRRLLDDRSGGARPAVREGADDRVARSRQRAERSRIRSSSVARLAARSAARRARSAGERTVATSSIQVRAPSMTVPITAASSRSNAGLPGTSR